MTIPGNTYTGGTHVVSGEMQFGASTFPEGTPVRLGDASGNAGTLQLPTGSHVISDLGGNGTVKSYTSLTVSNIVVDARRLVANTAALTCNGGVTLAEGAKVKLENAEYLADAPKMRYDILTMSSGSVSGAIVMDSYDEAVAGKWNVHNLGDKVQLVRVRGLTIVVE